MEIKVLTESPDFLEIEILGEGHTFCNLLRDALNQESTVEHASYAIKHPLVSNPVLALRTKGAQPRKVLLSTLQSLKKQHQSLKTAFQKA